MTLQAEVIKKLIDVEQALLAGGKLTETRGLLTSMIDRANLCAESGLKVTEDHALEQFPSEVKEPEPVAPPPSPNNGPTAGPDNDGSAPG